MSPLLQRKLKQIEYILDSELNAEEASRILALIGSPLPEPNILDEIEIYADSYPDSLQFKYTSHQRYLHFLWDAFEKVPLSLVCPFAVSLRRALAARLFASCGNDFTAMSNVCFTYAPAISIGSNVFIDRNTCLDSRGGIWIGSNVSIADNVSVMTSADGPPSAQDQRYSVWIDDYAKIGPHAIVFPGVSIGQWAVIEAGSIVRQDIPAFSVAQNTPAKKAPASKQPHLEITR